MSPIQEIQGLGTYGGTPVKKNVPQIEWIKTYHKPASHFSRKNSVGKRVQTGMFFKESRAFSNKSVPALHQR